MTSRQPLMGWLRFYVVDFCNCRLSCGIFDQRTPSRTPSLVTKPRYLQQTEGPRRYKMAIAPMFATTSTLRPALFLYLVMSVQWHCLDLEWDDLFVNVAFVLENFGWFLNSPSKSWYWNVSSCIRLGGSVAVVNSLYWLRRCWATISGDIFRDFHCCNVGPWLYSGGYLQKCLNARIR